MTAVALFPLTSFFAAVHETVTDSKVVAMGPAASITSIPAGYTYTTVLLSPPAASAAAAAAATVTTTTGKVEPSEEGAAVGGQGITATFRAVGDLLLGLSGKSRPNPYRDSFALSHLGYWVDNGSPYYHRNDSYAVSQGLERCNAALNCTLEDGLRAVQADAVERQIPLRYYQFDDHESLDAYHWPETLETPYLNSESFSQRNAGNVVFQSGVTFLGMGMHKNTMLYDFVIGRQGRFEPQLFPTV